MTGGGDLDEIEDEDDDVGDDVSPPVAEADLDLNLNDRIPAAGVADVGGRAADDEWAPQP